jgi:hypothetical protein
LDSGELAETVETWEQKSFRNTITGKEVRIMGVRDEATPDLNDVDASAASASADECGSCPSNEVLSSNEEWILSEMRAIKGAVSPIAKRLEELEGRIKDPPLAQTDSERNEEWAKLEGQMAELREEWEKWHTRLEEAIEQKLICLGHREPRS